MLSLTCKYVHIYYIYYIGYSIVKYVQMCQKGQNSSKLHSFDKMSVVDYE